MEAQTKSIDDLIELLNQNPKPTELEITVLPFEKDGNSEIGGEADEKHKIVTKSLTPFLKHEIHLGINFLVLPQLAMEFRKAYNATRKQYQSNKNNFSFESRMMDIVTCLLLVCPDNLTAWYGLRP